MHSMALRSYSRRAARAFTLLELVVVLSILAILAGGILVKLDVLQLRANKGVSASSMAGISRMIQTYVVTNNHYPDGFDSLIDDNGGSPQLYAGLDPQLIGGLGGASPTKLTTTTIASASELRSLNRMGITSLFEVDAGGGLASGFPSDVFQTSRTLGVGATVATLNPPAEGDATAILQHFYPNEATLPPAGKKVLVFGLGPRCSLIGRSGMLQEAPLYANSADKVSYYARHLVAFEVDTGGGRARFLGALGADADRLDEELSEYYELQ